MEQRDNKSLTFCSICFCKTVCFSFLRNDKKKKVRRKRRTNDMCHFSSYCFFSCKVFHAMCQIFIWNKHIRLMLQFKGNRDRFGASTWWSVMIIALHCITFIQTKKLYRVQSITSTQLGFVKAQFHSQSQIVICFNLQRNQIFFGYFVFSFIHVFLSMFVIEFWQWLLQPKWEK